MYTSTIAVPRVTETTLAQLEAVAPGIVALHSLKTTETAEAAVEISSDTLRPKLHYRESIGDVDVAETSTGWIVTTEILEFGR